MLSKYKPIDFKKAIIITENAYLEGQLDKEGLDKVINFYASICRGVIAAGDIDYAEKDKDKASINVQYLCS